MKRHFVLFIFGPLLFILALVVFLFPTEKIYSNLESQYNGKQSIHFLVKDKNHNFQDRFSSRLSQMSFVENIQVKDYTKLYPQVSEDHWKVILMYSVELSRPITNSNYELLKSLIRKLAPEGQFKFSDLKEVTSQVQKDKTLTQGQYALSWILFLVSLIFYAIVLLKAKRDLLLISAYRRMGKSDSFVILFIFMTIMLSPISLLSFQVSQLSAMFIPFVAIVLLTLLVSIKKVRLK